MNFSQMQSCPDGQEIWTRKEEVRIRKSVSEIISGGNIKVNVRDSPQSCQYTDVVVGNLFG